jgi:prolyl-tRNA synthetase
LGQNFAKASGIRLQSADEVEDYAWTTSWGASTRLIGGLIMTHSDDDGLIVPPKVAPAQIVLLPIAHKPEDRQNVLEYCDRLAGELGRKFYNHRHLVVEVDKRDIGGARGWDWIKKGVPLRVEIGPRDIADDAVFVARRDKGHREKSSIPRRQFISQVGQLLDEIQENLFKRALDYQQANTLDMDDKGAFYDFFTPRNKNKPEIHGGFAKAHWCGDAACEAKLKEDLTVTIRCIPFEASSGPGQCICCGKSSEKRVVFAKAY